MYSVRQKRTVMLPTLLQYQESEAVQVEPETQEQEVMDSDYLIGKAACWTALCLAC